MTLEYDRLYIGGGWVPPSTSATIDVHSPSTETKIGRVPEAKERDVDAAVNAARAAFDNPEGWSNWSPDRRVKVLERFAKALEGRATDMAHRVSSQNGMPIWLAEQWETTYPSFLLRYYGQMVVDNQEEVRQGLLGKQSLVLREPIGVVAAIVPWNVPQAITFMKVAPALAAGCTVVLKPAPETVLDAFLMAEAASEAGLPNGVLNVVPAHREVAAYLVQHPGIDKVSFTGSTAAGRSIAATCGQLLRPVTLELGGKSAAILLDDVDLVANIDAFFATTMLNNGQVCWLSTRVLAPRSRYEEIVETITDMASGLTVGDPLDPSNKIGPLVSEAQRQRVENLISKGKQEGARITTGGGRPPGIDRGWYVEPTVFADVDRGATIAQQEIFGPVLTVTPYENEQEAIAIANDSQYGLGGSIWTADPERGTGVARKISTGTVSVNQYITDPISPFGGIKSSGWGRELGKEGITSFQHLKSVFLDRENTPA